VILEADFIPPAEYRCSAAAARAGVLCAGPSPDREEADTLKSRLGKIMIGAAVGAGALGVGFGGSLAVANAATTHSTPSSTTSSTTSTTSSTTGATAASAASAKASPSPSASHKATHNCQNMKNGQGPRGKPASSSTGS
jgi:hypothetical protein